MAELAAREGDTVAHSHGSTMLGRLMHSVAAAVGLGGDSGGGGARGASAGGHIDAATNHSGCSTISCGSPNVVIEGKPAARATSDRATHGTSLVATGSATVLVNGKPLARISEKATCSGTIVATSSRTFIGGPSSPAPAAAAAAGAPAGSAAGAVLAQAPTGAALAAAVRKGAGGGDTTGRTAEERERQAAVDARTQTPAVREAMARHEAANARFLA